MLETAAGDTRVALDPGRVHLTVADEAGPLLSGGLSVVADGTTLPAGPADPVDAAPGDAVVYGPARDVPLSTTVALSAADGCVDLSVTLHNVGDEPVTVERAELPAGDELPPFGAAARVFEHGYQSWTPTGAWAPGEHFPAEPPGQRPMMVDPAAPADWRTSHYLTALSAGDRALVAGFLAHDRFLPRFDVGEDADGVDALAAVVPGEGVTVAPGERLSLPPVRFAAGDVEDGLAVVATGVADRMDARVPAAAPTGWCSWYDYGRAVTPADVRENMAAIDELSLPLETVQLDDGYETAFGDWRSLAADFEDPGALVDDIVDADHRPGLWMAPFLAEGDADVVQENPEWVLRRDGDPVDAGRRHGQMVALDPTHPGVEAWLQDTVGTVVDGWGFDYLKLDFLYAAALPGDHHDEDATRTEAYRRGMRTIRSAAGEDALLLGCGAPLAPSVGLVDAMRVGPDVGPEWVDDDAGSQPGMRNALRNSLHRQFTHRRWWVNDPDCQLLRPSTGLSEPERRSFAAVVALSGGANVVSDRLADLDEVGLDLLRTSLPPVEGGTVEGAGVQALPDRLVCRRPDGGAAVAAFNWDEGDRAVTVDPAAHGVEDAVGWLPDEAAAVERSVERSVPAHGCLLVHLAPARAHPHVVGAVDHLAAGGSLLDVTWEADGDAGSLHVAVDADRPLSLVVATPGSWRPRGDHEQVDGYLAVEVPPGGRALRFER